ncbi:hypothetical protein [Clostridium lundense]|uniref:hypothetical protein n=1 Tax=Clostridium lundense TaxID=319475 RepID=UPI00048987DC|nr:hypothetical protein [Clostridium lundense]
MFKNIMDHIKTMGIMLIINIIICFLIWITKSNKSLESLSNILFYSSGILVIITASSAMGNLKHSITDRYYSYIGSTKKGKEDSIRLYMKLQDKSMNFSIVLSLVAAITIGISLLILKF